MNTTWIKLFRKLKDHEIMRDSLAVHVFVWILISVDYKTGSMVSGRFWASSLLGIKDTTYYKVLKRLEKKYNLVTLSGNNKNTIVLVKNWNKYQGDSNTTSDNEVTTKGQQSNTNQEIKEIKNIYNSNEVKIFSYFNSLKEDETKIVELAKEFDVRPKDIVYVIREMLSKESEKEKLILNVKSKFNTYMNNSIRWHKVATLSDKENQEKQKKKVKLSKEDQEALEILRTAIIRG